MSREIDPDKIASGELDEDELRYLQDRNLLPADYDGEKLRSDLSEPTPLADQPNTGDANTKPATESSQGGKAPVDEEEEEDEDYDEGWNNDARRAELSKRGLNVDGTKQEMIDRLIADDQSKEAAGAEDKEETTE